MCRGNLLHQMQPQNVGRVGVVRAGKIPKNRFRIPRPVVPHRQHEPPVCQLRRNLNITAAGIVPDALFSRLSSARVSSSLSASSTVCPAGSRICSPTL